MTRSMPYTSGGKFELIGVRASKFRYIDTGKYDNRNVGASDKAVYCGNLVMSGLDPKGVRALWQWLLWRWQDNIFLR